MPIFEGDAALHLKKISKIFCSLLDNRRICRSFHFSASGPTSSSNSGGYYSRKPELNLKKKLKVCTYSRVIKEKGILDAIEIVKSANQMLGENKFYLDIYGKISNEFKG